MVYRDAVASEDFYEQKLKSQFTSIYQQSLGLGFFAVTFCRAGTEGLVERMKVLFSFLLLLCSARCSFSCGLVWECLFLHPLGWSSLNWATVLWYKKCQLPCVKWSLCAVLHRMLWEEVDLWLLASFLEGCQTFFPPPSRNGHLITWRLAFPRQ